MDSFGHLLTGSIQWKFQRLPASSSSSRSLEVSTQVITNIVTETGNPKPTIIGDFGVGIGVADHTTLSSTSILGLPAFHFIRRWVSKYDQTDLRQSLDISGSGPKNDVDNSDPLLDHMSLKASLEQLFDNMTLSMMSLDVLQYDCTPLLLLEPTLTYGAIARTIQTRQ